MWEWFSVYCGGVRVRLVYDEWYPCLTVAESWGAGGPDEFDVPDEVVVRYRGAVEELGAAQEAVERAAGMQVRG